MIKGRAVLIQEDKSKGNEGIDYHPITCLPLTWKLLTGIIAEEIYGFLQNKDITRRADRIQKKVKGYWGISYT